MNIELAVSKMSKLIKEDIDEIKRVLSKYQIRRLLTVKDRLTGLKSDLKETKDNLKNLSDFVLKQY